MIVRRVAVDEAVAKAVKEKVLEELKELIEYLEKNAGNPGKVSSGLKFWPLFKSETAYLSGSKTSSVTAARGLQLNRKDKDLMSDTGGRSKNRADVTKIRAPRDDVRNPWRTKDKPSKDRDPDVDNDPDLKVSRRCREAGIKDVVQKAIRRFTPDVVNRIVEKLENFLKTRNPKYDLDNQEVRKIYRHYDYGERLPLTKKRNVDLGWTDHAEYRSDLRGIDPKRVNRSLRDRLRDKLVKTGPESKKVKMKMPGTGTAVVDYNLHRDPADVDVITVWGSTRDRVAMAMRVAESERERLLRVARFPSSFRI